MQLDRDQEIAAAKTVACELALSKPILAPAGDNTILLEHRVGRAALRPLSRIPHHEHAHPRRRKNGNRPNRPGRYYSVPCRHRGYRLLGRSAEKERRRRPIILSGGGYSYLAGDRPCIVLNEHLHHSPGQPGTGRLHERAGLRQFRMDGAVFADRAGVVLRSVLLPIKGGDASGLSGTALKAGAYIVVPSGDNITAITMSSGSVIIYNQ